MLAFLESPQSCPDDLARVVVAAAAHFLLDEVSSSGVSETFIRIFSLSWASLADFIQITGMVEFCHFGPNS
jgi:hypothetical protein